MRSIALILSLCTLLTLSAAWADEASCPLSNPAYKDLRLAALKLQEKLTLPPGCEKVESELHDLGSSIKTSIDSVYDQRAQQQARDGIVLTDDQAKAADEARLKLKTAVDSLQTVSHVISNYGRKGTCGKAVMSNLDYLEAIVDTVNGLAPYFLVYGGASSAPIVLGASVLGTLGKTFMTFFRSTLVDMDDPKQRRLFIENSCAFHEFNRNYEALQNRDFQIEESKVTLAKLKAKLAALEAAGAPVIPPELEPFALADTGNKEDQAVLSSYRDAATRFEKPEGTDLLACSFVHDRVNEGMHTHIADRLTFLLMRSKSDGLIVTASYPLVSLFLASSPRFMGVPLDDSAQVKSCAEAARVWMVVADTLMKRVDLELDRPGRRDVTFKERRKWDADKAEARTAIQNEEARAKWLGTLSDIGEAIENSEISQARDDSRDALFMTQSKQAFFGVFSVNQKSPAELWLLAKRRSSKRKLEEFEAALVNARLRWAAYLPTPKEDALPTDALRNEACSQMSSVTLNWSAAKNHSEAGVAFCRVFRNTISDLYYPEVSNLCFGPFNKEARVYTSAPMDEDLAKVHTYDRQIQQIADWMKLFKCPLPSRLKFESDIKSAS